MVFILVTLCLILSSASDALPSCNVEAAIRMLYDYGNPEGKADYIFNTSVPIRACHDPALLHWDPSSYHLDQNEADGTICVYKLDPAFDFKSIKTRYGPLPKRMHYICPRNYHCSQGMKCQSPFENFLILLFTVFTPLIFCALFLQYCAGFKRKDNDTSSDIFDDSDSENEKILEELKKNYRDVQDSLDFEDFEKSDSFEAIGENVDLEDIEEVQYEQIDRMIDALLFGE